MEYSRSVIPFITQRDIPKGEPSVSYGTSRRCPDHLTLIFFGVSGWVTR